ncbi:MAG: hypothetical protein ACRYF5_15465, partial [Janthinobacterium lividum]
MYWIAPCCLFAHAELNPPIVQTPNSPAPDESPCCERPLESLDWFTDLVETAIELLHGFFA